jgi:hypothetical protein
MIGDPERIKIETAGSASTSEFAMARQRLKWPSPKLSWL